MGGRGSFIDVDTNNFSFRDGGQTYFSVGMIGNNIKVLVKTGGNSVKAPEYSHTKDRIYVILQNGKIKHIAFYDENHIQYKCIDFEHFHKGLKPHVHHDYKHVLEATDLTVDEKELYKQIKGWLDRNGK